MPIAGLTLGLINYKSFTYSQYHLIRPKLSKDFRSNNQGVKFRFAFNIGSQWGVPSKLVENASRLPMVELNRTDCISAAVTGQT